MSANVKWREGSHPANKDEWVRFKTTYYFRVVDTCIPPKPQVLSNASDDVFYKHDLNPRDKSKGYILSDTLYRFNMTGKAHEWSAVKFEAGTLLASQIDPFGNTILTKDGKISYQSAGQRAHELMENTQKRKYEELKEELNEVQKKIDDLETDKEAQGDAFPDWKNELLTQLGEQQNKIQNLITQYYTYLFGTTSNSETNSPSYSESGKKYSLEVNNALTSVQDILDDLALAKLTLGNKQNFDVGDKISVSPSELSVARNLLEIAGKASTDNDADKITIEAASATINSVRPAEKLTCPPGLASNHGYLILGPEGWRHFDPEQRLLLAMSSSEKPLISTMTELSSRMQQAKQEQADPSPLAEEKQRVLALELKYRREGSGKDSAEERLAVAEQLGSLINEFNATNSQNPDD